MNFNDFLKDNYQLSKKDLISLVKQCRDLESNPERDYLNVEEFDYNKKTKEFSFSLNNLVKQDFYINISKIFIRAIRFVDINDKEALNLAYKLFVSSSLNDDKIIDSMCKECNIENNRIKNIDYMLIMKQNTEKGIPVAVLKNDNKNEFVIAYNYDEKTNSWGSGHYFENNDFGSAMVKFTSYFNENVENMLNNKTILRDEFLTDYISNILQEYDSVNLNSMNENEIKNLKNDILENVNNNDELWNSIDSSIYSTIDNILENKMKNVDKLKESDEFTEKYGIFADVVKDTEKLVKYEKS